MTDSTPTPGDDTASSAAIADDKGKYNHPLKATFNVWWHPDEPDRIRLATNDEDITDENEAHPGLQVVFSSNPDSADYHPGNFNRMARWLEKNEKPAPPTVEKKSRRLRDR